MTLQRTRRVLRGNVVGCFGWGSSESPQKTNENHKKKGEQGQLQNEKKGGRGGRVNLREKGNECTRGKVRRKKGSNPKRKREA